MRSVVRVCFRIVARVGRMRVRTSACVARGLRSRVSRVRVPDMCVSLCCGGCLIGAVMLGSGVAAAASNSRSSAVGFTGGGFATVPLGASEAPARG